ncbi:MAG: protease inhibitor I42 family protein [Mycobacteriaceae bacterium]|nr:protease inhibitor I42 family protein [Mycobacteriaceae bacterium]
MLVVGLLPWLGLSCAAKPDSRTSPQHQIKTINVTYDELLSTKFITRHVTLARGDTLQVTLASNRTTGFCWTPQTQIVDPTVIQQVSHESPPANSSIPGAASTEVWTFAALKAGGTTITTDYSQPWPGGTKKAWTFTATVDVR